MIKMNEILMEQCNGTQFCPMLRKIFDVKIGLDCTQEDWIHFFVKAATWRDSSIAWIQEKSCWYSSDSGTHRWGNTQTEINRSCADSMQLKSIYLPQVLRVVNVWSHEKVSWQEESKVKKEDHIIFFTLLASFGSDAHEREEPSDYYSKPRKVPYEGHWRGDQNAVFWVKLSRAQDLGLQFWQTKSNAIIVHQSVPHQCIERVVGDDGGRIIFQRILTPKRRPNS